MESAARQVGTHIVRQHRRVRRRLPDLAALARAASSAGQPQQQGPAARRALRLLEQDVLGQADVEDALVAGGLGRMPAATLRRLRPEHDSLRIGADRLRSFVEAPEDDRLDVAGLLGGLGRLLRTHLDDEWRSLMPALAELDDRQATPLLHLFDASRGDLDVQPARLHLPVAFDLIRDRLAGAAIARVAPRAGAAAQAAARRVATGLAVPGASHLTVHADMLSAITTQRVILLVGRLRSPEIETVFAPVEFDVTLTRDGPTATTLEIRHDVVPARYLPPDVPARDVAAAAVNALAGELAFIGIDQDRGHEGHPPPSVFSHAKDLT